MTREEAIEILVTCVVRPDPDSDGGYWTPLQAFPVGSAGEQAIRLLKDSRHRAHATACPTEGCDRGLGHPGFCNPRKVAFAWFSQIAKERGYVRDDAAQLWRRGGHTVFDSSVGVERAEDVFDELPKSTSVDESVNSDARRYVGTFDGVRVTSARVGTFPDEGDSAWCGPMPTEELWTRAKDGLVKNGKRLAVWMTHSEAKHLLSWVIPDPGTEVPEETAKVLRARGLVPIESVNGGPPVGWTGAPPSLAEAARDTLDSAVAVVKTPKIFASPGKCVVCMNTGRVENFLTSEPCPNGCVPGKTKGW